MVAYCENHMKIWIHREKNAEVLESDLALCRPTITTRL
jgi:hypothetical protein